MVGYFFLVLVVSAFLTYVSANPPIPFEDTFKKHVENCSKNVRHSNKVCRGLAMLHLFNTPIVNTFDEIFPDALIKQWENAGNKGKVEYEKAVKANFKAIANDGWTNSKNFRKKYSSTIQGKFENKPLSLENGYYLFTGLTGGNAKKSTEGEAIDAKDAEELKMMLDSEELEGMNFKANENLDTDITRIIRDRYFAKSFSYVVTTMKEMVHKMEAANTIEAANTMLSLHAAPAYGHGPPKKQKGTHVHTGPPDTHLNDTGLHDTPV